MKRLFYFLLTVIFFLCTAMSCEEEYITPMSLVDIELVNIDNSGENMVESDEAIRKEAYVIGLRYLVSDNFKYSDGEPHFIHNAGLDENIYIDNINSNPKIYCLSDFDSEHLAGSDITEFFTFYTNNDSNQNMLLILRKAPHAGSHSFKVEFECTNDTIVSKNTTPVILY